MIDNADPEFNQVPDDKDNEDDPLSTKNLMLNLNNALIGDLQRADPTFGPIMKSIKEGLSSPRYCIEEGRLFFVNKATRRDIVPTTALCIPTTLVKTVFKSYHDSNSHIAADRLFLLLRGRFYWPNMYTDAVQYVKKCPSCIASSLAQSKVPTILPVVPTRPNQIVQIDFYGPLIESFSGMKYLLTLIDGFSSWPFAWATADKSAKTVVKMLLTEFIPLVGTPQTLISDRGLEFNNELLDLLADKLNIRRIMTSPYNAQANGKIERWHRWLTDTLRKSTDASLRTWPDDIPYLLMAFRTAPTSPSGHSPFFLTYMRPCELPGDLLFQPKLLNYSENYVTDQLSKMHYYFTEARDSLLDKQLYNKQYKDGDAKFPNYEIGDSVWYFYNGRAPGVGQSRKNLVPKWSPHWRIVEKINDLTYRIRHEPRGIVKIAHSKHLKPADPAMMWNKVYESDFQPVTPRRIKKVKWKTSGSTPTEVRDHEVFTKEQKAGEAVDKQILQKDILDRQNNVRTRPYLSRSAKMTRPLVPMNTDRSFRQGDTKQQEASSMIPEVPDDLHGDMDEPVLPRTLDDVQDQSRRLDLDQVPLEPPDDLDEDDQLIMGDYIEGDLMDEDEQMDDL
jgi:transposase InsO family protein